MYSSWGTCDTVDALSGAWQKARGAASFLLQTMHFTAFPDVFRCRLSHLYRICQMMNRTRISLLKTPPDPCCTGMAEQSKQGHSEIDVSAIKM